MENNNTENVLEIDLTRLIAALWKRIWAIILAAVIGAGALGVYAATMVKPTYSAQSLMYVNNRTLSLNTSTVNISSGEITAAASLVNTYIVILESRTTLNDVIREANLGYTYDKLKNMISCGSVNGTQIFSIKVTSTDPEEAALIANTIASVLPDKIAQVVDGASVRVVDYAVTPSHKVAPSISKYAAVGALLAAFIVCAIVVVFELLDDAVHSADYVSQTYGIPNLAVIPDFESLSGKNKGKDYNYYYYDYYSKGKGVAD